MVRKLKVTNFLNSENSDDFLEMAYNAETKTKAKSKKDELKEKVSKKSSEVKEKKDNAEDKVKEKKEKVKKETKSKAKEKIEK